MLLFYNSNTNFITRSIFIFIDLTNMTLFENSSSQKNVITWL